MGLASRTERRWGVPQLPREIVGIRDPASGPRAGALPPTLPACELGDPDVVPAGPGGATNLSASAATRAFRNTFRNRDARIVESRMTKEQSRRKSGPSVYLGGQGPVNLRRLSARVSSELGLHSPQELCVGMSLISPDRITLLGRLSKGSYAVVDLAKLREEGADEQDKGRKVAIKRLRSSAFTERDVTCFAREAELLLSIQDHP